MPRTRGVPTRACRQIAHWVNNAAAVACTTRYLGVLYQVMDRLHNESSFGQLAECDCNKNAIIYVLRDESRAVLHHVPDTCG